jgi:glycine cleavage system H lipoate-binding protein
VNAALADEPAPLNDDPFGAGWLAEIKLAAGLPEGLMQAGPYRQSVE